LIAQVTRSFDYLPFKRRKMSRLNFEWKVLCLVGLLVVLSTSQQQVSYTAIDKLYENLLQGYNKNIRPGEFKTNKQLFCKEYPFFLVIQNWFYKICCW